MNKIQNNSTKMYNVETKIAEQGDVIFAEGISKLILKASKVKGTGISKRSVEYITEKIVQGKAIISFVDGEPAGFCYIETWGHDKFIANSGLIVSQKYRKLGLAKAIKSKAFELSQKKYPKAKIFGLTTSLAVMKINSDLGYRPVTFSQLTTDDNFWKGCQTCEYYDILVRTKREHCLCNGMLFVPSENNIKENM